MNIRRAAKRALWLSLIPALCTALFFGWKLYYYGRYWSIERQLAAQPSVTIINSWKHEKSGVKDCGFDLQVRNCPPIRVEFYNIDLPDRGPKQFQEIEGVVVCGDSRSEDKRFRVDWLKERGLEIRNVPDVLANLERFLEICDSSPPNEAWPETGGNWMIICYPSN